MEDDSLIQNLVKNLLEKELHCKVTVVNNREQAIKLAQQESAFFILDVNMGRGREQEGLDALEEIKAINSNTPVFILSAYEQYEILARNLNANGFIQKEADLKQVIRSKIEPEILKYELQVLEARKQEIQDKFDKLLYPTLDPNIQAYEDLINLQEILDKYQDQYVAFLGGEIIDFDLDKVKLLERLQQNYRNQSCFFKQVKKDYEIIDLPYYDII